MCAAPKHDDRRSSRLQKVWNVRSRNNTAELAFATLKSSEYISCSNLIDAHRYHHTSHVLVNAAVNFVAEGTILSVHFFVFLCP